MAEIESSAGADAAAAPDGEPVAAPPVAEDSAGVVRPRLEIEHRDQLLALAEERRAGLEREIERLDRQLNAAIEAQREGATERSELRRLLGNAQMQVHSMMQIAPPADQHEDGAVPEQPQPEAPEPEANEPEATEPEATEPARARPPRPASAGSIVFAQPPAAPAPDPQAGEADGDPGTRVSPTRRRRRGLAGDVSEVVSGLRRLFPG